MAVFYINGGCDAEYNALGAGTCEPESCDSDARWSAYNWTVESASFSSTACPNAAAAGNDNVTVIFMVAGLVVGGLILIALSVYVVRMCVKKKDDTARSTGNANVDTDGNATQVGQSTVHDATTEDGGL